MATFYGQVWGSAATGATRCGTKHSGIRSSVQHERGSVTTKLYENGDELLLDVEMEDYSGMGGRLVFHGPIEDFELALEIGIAKIKSVRKN